jgi:hypothetical protein
VSHVLSGIQKAAGFGSAVASVGKQLAGGASKAVGKRMMRRGLWGAGIGAAGSMVQQKMRGEDISVGRAAAGAAIGGGIGALAGTTAGAKGFRKLTRPASTQHQSFKESINPGNWFKKSPNISTPRPGGGHIVTKGRTAIGNLSPLEKGFLGVNAVGTAKQLHDPESKGHRGQILGSSAGLTAATLAGSRWGAMRRGGFGNTVKGLGLFAGADAAGSAAGKAIDKKMHPEAQNA